MSAAPESLADAPGRRLPSAAAWLVLTAQLLVIEILDAANDIIRGDLIPPSPQVAIDNALRLVAFESDHGFFIEPRLYRFAERAHTLLGVRVPAPLIVGVANNVYAFFHIGVPVLVAVWVYIARRNRFGLLRNVLICAGIVTLAGYFLFPVAPPRLTAGILIHGHAVQFHDTMPYPKNSIRLNGRPLGYNPYAAMPSLHIAWATIIAGTVFLLARNPVLRVLALIYPVLMTLAIVITANHYIMDAVGGVLTVVVAFPLALLGTRLLERRL
jgi:hypothetical protein